MTQRTFHALLTCVYSFCLIVFVVLLVLVSGVFAVLWLLLVVLASMLHARLKPALWQQEKALWQERRNKRHPENQNTNEFVADHYLEDIASGGRIRHLIDAEKVVVGRGVPGYDELNNNLMVAREQFRIHYRSYSHEYYIEDMRSRNGTFLNARPLEPYHAEKLQDNAEISFCGVRYRFVRR